MLHGFSIGGYRNFTGPTQFITSLSRVNIFIGTNNSGKSNVLRYIEKVLAPAIRPGRHEPIQLKGIDVPRSGSASDTFVLTFPFRPTEHIQQGIRWLETWSKVLSDHGFLRGEMLSVPVTLREASQQRYFAGPLPSFSNEEAKILQQAWSAVTGFGGGSAEQWLRDLMNRFLQRAFFEIRPHFVPSFRQLTTRIEEFTNEYKRSTGDAHLIDRLAELAYPPYDQQDLKKKFEKLRLFLAQIVDDPNLEIEIPNNRETINIKSGDVFLPIEALGSGIHEVVMLAAELLLNDNSTILLEEPEVHLHPHLQRRLMRFIIEQTSAQYFITTHSSSVIDTGGATIFGVSSTEGHASVRPLIATQDKFEACKELGFRASDLLQANCVIWVEGPSDRIYLLSWISRFSAGFVEGVDFVIMFYGGKLLSQLTLEDSEFGDLINLLQICRHAAVLVDSDRGSVNASIRGTKLRIQKEVSEIGGYFWLTDGREIENYFSPQTRLNALKQVYGDNVELTGSKSKYGKPLNFRHHGGPEKTSGFDKVKIAKYIVSSGDEPNIFAKTKIYELLDYIKRCNS